MRFGLKFWERGPIWPAVVTKSVFSGRLTKSYLCLASLEHLTLPVSAGLKNGDVAAETCFVGVRIRVRRALVALDTQRLPVKPLRCVRVGVSTR